MAIISTIYLYYYSINTLLLIIGCWKDFSVDENSYPPGRSQRIGTAISYEYDISYVLLIAVLFVYLIECR